MRRRFKIKLLFAGVVTSLILVGLAHADPEQEDSPPPKAAKKSRTDQRAPGEAIEACRGKKSGDICEFSIQAEKKHGMCYRFEKNKILACKPAEPPEDNGSVD